MFREKEPPLSVVELEVLIKETDGDTHTKLLNFLEAYQAWYEVHIAIDKEGASGNLTEEQDGKLMKAIENRDSTRKSLIEHLDKNS